MTDYTFDQIIAVDPSHPQLVASNGVVTIFAPGDATKTPLALKTLTGLPLPNPVTVNNLGMGPAFIAQLWQVAWEGGGLAGQFTSNIGLRDQAVAAVTAAETAQAAAETAASTAGTEAAAAASSALAGAVADADAAATSAASSAALVNAPADTAVQTLINASGSATRAALKTTVAGEVTDTASATRAALNATYVSMAQAQVGIDEDGAPYFASGLAFSSAVPVLTDTDGVPYINA
jgi:hypothetical protein